MFSALALPIEASLFSYAACAGRRSTAAAGSSTLRGVLLAEARARRQLHTAPSRRSSNLERSYSTTSEESNASSSSETTFESHSSSSSSGSSSSSSSAPASTPPTEAPSSSSSSGSTSPIFQFLLSVSFLGKPAHPDDPTSYSFTFSPNSPVRLWRDAQLKRYGRDWKGKGKNRAISHDAGDDFFFLDNFANEQSQLHGLSSHNAAFGVADGVGGWSESGVDPGVFSQALMYYAQKTTDDFRAEAAKSGDQEVGSPIYPHDVLRSAYDSVMHDKEVVAGSSTATIVTLDGHQGVMRAANLGDSSFAIVRSDKVVHQQPPQQHYFNCPYQLSKLPPSMQGDPRSIVDEANQADLFETQLQDGDIILAFTDGFGDNVFMREVEVLLQRLRDQKEYNVGDGFEQQYADKIADSLVSYAKLCSEKKDKQSPFELEAKRNRMIYKGGKVDDICVAVALVKQVN